MKAKWQTKISTAISQQCLIYYIGYYNMVLEGFNLL